MARKTNETVLLLLVLVSAVFLVPQAISGASSVYSLPPRDLEEWVRTSHETGKPHPLATHNSQSAINTDWALGLPDNDRDYQYLDLNWAGRGSPIDVRSISDPNGHGGRPNHLNLILTSSGNPVLTSLTVSAGTLTPTFSGTEVEYTVSDVPYATRVLTISAVPESGAAISFWHYPNGQIAELVDEDDMTGGHQVYLGIGEKTVEVSVSKGSRYRDYRLVITRAKPMVSIKALTTDPATEGDTLKFEIKRSAIAPDFLAVRVAADELDATAGQEHDDILPDAIEDKSPKYYIEGGDNTAILELETTNDDVWENHSKVELTIVAGDLYTIDSSANVASIVVRDDEFLGSEAVLTVVPNPVGEGVGKAVATVTVTTNGDKSPHGQVSIPLTTSDNTSTSGVDYTGLNTTLIFMEEDFSEVTLEGDTRYRAVKTADISITQDSADEEDENFYVDMGLPSDSIVTRDSDTTSVSVTITDDDAESMPPTLTGLTVSSGTLTPAFSSSNFSYSVPDVEYGTHIVTITSTSESGASVSFLDSSNDVINDLDDMSDGHQVYLGIGETTVKIRVTEGELTQDYMLALTRAKPMVSIQVLTSEPAVEGDTLMFEVKRAQAAGDALAINVVVDELAVDTDSDSGDVFPDSKEGVSLAYEIRVDEVTATLEIGTNGDEAWENHSRVEMRIVADDSYTVDSSKDSAKTVVKDDDFPESEAALEILPNPVGEGAGTTMATVTVTTDDEKMPHGQMSIQITTSDNSAKAGEDYAEIDSTLVFEESDFVPAEDNGARVYKASKEVEIEILRDNLDEEIETFNVMLGQPDQSIVDLDTDSRTVPVVINDSNSKPMVTVSTMPSPARVLGRGVVTLNGTSSDSDNDTLTYAWTSIPVNTGEFADATQEDTTWTAPAPLAVEQEVTLSLTVTDDGSLPEHTTVEIAVTVEANAVPSVNASASMDTIHGGDMIALTGEGIDPEKGLLAYTWSGAGRFLDPNTKDTIWTAPPATDHTQTIILTLTVVDELGLEGTDSIPITVAASNRPPSFPPSEKGVRSLEEGNEVGGKVGVPVAAVDEEGDSLTYSVGGADAEVFSIDDAGQITVANGIALNYEMKTSYLINVLVSDGMDKEGNLDAGVDATKEVVINVDDVEEEGEVLLDELLPQVGIEVTAMVLDPDNYTISDPSGGIPGSSIVSWVWDRSDDVEGPWLTIHGAVTATYIPIVEDKEAHLRVTAMYMDRRGPGKIARGTSGGVGPGVPSAPTSPAVSYSSGASGLEVSWSPPASDGGDAVTGYSVEWKPAPAPNCPPDDGWHNGSGVDTNKGDGQCKVGVEQRNVTGTTYTIVDHNGDKLIAGTSYYVRVAAQNSVGIGDWSEAVMARVPSADARLQSLTVSPVDIGGFSAETTSYGLVLGSKVTEVTVTAVVADTNAIIAFGPPVDSNTSMDGHQFVLIPGDNIVTVPVTAEDGVSTLTYTIIITQVMGNSTPSVSVSPDMAIINGCNAVTLNGTSSDPENDLLTYSWVASPDIGHFADWRVEDTVWTAPLPEPLPQTITLTLTVDDGRGGTASDSVVVTVRPFDSH